MAYQIYAGSTSQTVRFFIQDTSSTAGAGLTGLTNSTSGLTCYYSKGIGAASLITLALQTATGAYTSGGFCAVDGTNMPGVYRLDLPDVVVDTEAEVIVMLKGAANMAPVSLRITCRKLQANAVTVADKTGYSLSQTFPLNFSSLGINSSGHISRVTLVDTTTTNVDMRGTDNALLTASYTAPDNAGIGTLLTRMTASRALYLDNLNISGPVASQADINALNQSASRRLILTTLQQLERPESGSTSYQIEARTFDGDGAAVNADSTPTLTATGILSGSLAANLSAATNPATGVYRWTYSVTSGATQEQIRFDLSAVLSASTFTIAAFSSVVDLVSATWTSTDATKLTAIYNKLPSRSYLTGATSSTGALVPGDILNQSPTGGWTNGSFGDRWLLGANNNREVFVTGSQHVAADIHAFQTNVLDANATDVSFVTELQAGLSTLTGPDVRAEVMDVLTSEVFAELSAIPGASSTILDRISLLFTLARNKMTQTSTLQTLFADDGTTAIGTASVSDNGTTFTKGELG